MLGSATSHSCTCRYFNQLRRHNYVTPTSYLELILTFKKLVQAKRTEIQTLQQRYLTGLEKLEFAASQVELRGTMQMDGMLAVEGFSEALKSMYVILLLSVL